MALWNCGEDRTWFRMTPEIDLKDSIHFPTCIIVVHGGLAASIKISQGKLLPRRLSPHRRPHFQDSGRLY